MLVRVRLDALLVFNHTRVAYYMTVLPDLGNDTFFNFISLQNNITFDLFYKNIILLLLFT